jgi:hypothetical protein
MAMAQTAANSPQAHVLNVRLPNGQVEQIRYIGDVAPTVVLAPDAAMAPGFGPGSPFAMMERMSAEMDRQAAALFHEVDAMPMNAGVIPAMSGPGVCMHSVQVTYMGDGRAPHVVSQTSGNCGAVHGSTAPVMLPSAPVPRRAGPDVILAKADNRAPG